MLTDEEKKSDYLETLAEELRLNGFPAEVEDNEMVMQAIFGEYRYGWMLKGDLYYDLHMFLMCYGGRLQLYGMEANAAVMKTGNISRTKTGFKL